MKHYSEVSPDRLHSDGIPLVRPLALAPEQSADLVAFLRTLGRRRRRRAGAAAALSVTFRRSAGQRRRASALSRIHAAAARIDAARRAWRGSCRSRRSCRAVTAAVLSRSSCRTTGRAASAGGPWLAMLAANWRTDWQRGPSLPSMLSGRPIASALISCFVGELGEGGEVGRELAALQGDRAASRRHAQRVGGGDADGLGADIERHQAGRRAPAPSVPRKSTIAMRSGRACRRARRPCRRRSCSQPGLARHPVALAGIFRRSPTTWAKRCAARRTTPGGVSLSFSAATNSSGTVTSAGIDRRRLRRRRARAAPSRTGRGPNHARSLHVVQRPRRGSVVLKVCDSASARRRAVRLAPPAPVHLDAGEGQQVRRPHRDHARRRRRRQQHAGARQAARAQQQREQSAHRMADHDRLFRQSRSARLRGRPRSRAGW